MASTGAVNGAESIEAHFDFVKRRRSALSRAEGLGYKKMYFFYLVRCRDNSFYAGVSLDVKRRFAEHKDGKGGRYTRSHKPVEIVYTEQFETQREALARERQVKSWRREKKEDLIEYGQSKPAWLSGRAREFHPPTFTS